MVKNIFSRGLNIYQRNGINKLLNYGYRSLYKWMVLTPKYRLQYGDAAPSPNDRYTVDHSELTRTIKNTHIPSNKPLYGVLAGVWDEKTKTYDSSKFWQSLRRRFEDDAEWEETEYYNIIRETIEAGEYARWLDVSDPTLSDLDDHLKRLDNLYTRIKMDGFDSKYPIVVCIGRDGEWIVYQGNHRMIICHVLGLTDIPVRVRYRHKNWQKIRQKIIKGDFANIDAGLHQYVEHKDIQQLVA